MIKKGLFLLTLTGSLLFSTNAFALSGVTDVNSLGQYIYSNMENYVTPITANYPHPSEITRSIINNILSGAYIKDDYTAISFTDISFKEKTNSTNPSTVDLTITPTYVDTAEQEAYVNQQVPQIVALVVQPGMTDYQKVAVLHDWVVSHVKYDTTLKEISDYSALVDGKTVCRGYSMLLYKLLTNAGINTHIVTGEVTSGFRFRRSATGHAWNMVQLDGSWYFIDSTNDGLSTDSSTKFFLVSGKVLQQNGFIWNQSKYPSAPNNYKASTSTAPAAVSKMRITGLGFSTSPVTLSVSASYNNGTRASIPNAQVIWTSSNNDVAAVDSNGVVTFTENTGSVTITAVSGNVTATASTNVNYVLGMTRIVYSTTPQTVQLYKVYSNRVSVPASGVTWASLDTTIATVDSNGSVTFTGTSGTATITGTFNGQTVSQQIRVNTVPTPTRHWHNNFRW